MSSSSFLVLASLPGAAHDNRVVVLRGSHAESVAEANGFDTLPVGTVAQAAFLLDSGQAAFWLEDAADVMMVEMVTGLSFTRQAAPDSREDRLRLAWRTARSAAQLKALYRAAGIGSLCPDS
jgi:hypothetical protein